jgi:hypothetical protein
MTITVIGRINGSDQSYTFDNAPLSRRQAVALRDELERAGKFVAWLDTEDPRAPTEGTSRG